MVPLGKPGRPWRRRLLSLAMLLAAWLLVHWWQTRQLVSGPAPALSGNLLDGDRVDLARGQGQPRLVHFWADWCPLCRAEQGSIARIAQDYPVLTVALQSGTPEQVRAYLAAQNISFPTLADPHGDLAAAWGVRVVPTSFVIDGAGRIRFTEVGYTSEWGLRARLWVASQWASPAALE